MCVVSMITDHYREKWGELVPYSPQQYQPQDVQIENLRQFFNPVPQITKEEVEEFRRLLERAREYDKRNNEPECELSEKRDALLAIAKQLGVEINFL